MTTPTRPAPGTTRNLRRTVLGLTTGLVLASTVGCVPMTSTDPPPPVAGSPVAPTTTQGPNPTISVGPVTEPSLPTPSATSSTSTAPGLKVGSAEISGRSGSVSWRVRVPRFSGAPAAAEANRRVRAAVDDLISQARREGRSDGGVKRRLEGSGKVVTNDGRTVQVTVTYADFLTGTAHPSNYVTTTVVDVRRRTPVTLEQVFSNPTAAYRKLKPAVLRAAGEQASSIDQTGLAPKKANWANWQTNDTGMVFVFADYQLGTYGLRQYAVPWETVEPLLTGYARRLMAPS
ncbi:MAG TPA: hypothetical protein VFP34_16345 [Microlunatus sp.]|nr:hypothetical protein [Microlunatus sp.]